MALQVSTLIGKVMLKFWVSQKTFVDFPVTQCMGHGVRGQPSCLAFQVSAVCLSCASIVFSGQAYWLVFQDTGLLRIFQISSLDKQPLVLRFKTACLWPVFQPDYLFLLLQTACFLPVIQTACLLLVFQTAFLFTSILDSQYFFSIFQSACLFYEYSRLPAFY